MFRVLCETWDSTNLSLLGLANDQPTTTTPPPAPPPPPLPPPLFPLPPHEIAIIADANTSALASTALVFLSLDGLRANPPITMPAVGNQSQKGGPKPRFSALGRISAVPAPAVLIATVTVCTPLVPAGIVGLEHDAPAGSPVHVKLTAVANVAAPTGLTTTL